MAICPNCKSEVTEGAVFCDQCGTPLPAPEPSTPEAAAPPAGGSVICAACGAGNVPGEAFCDFCGSPLEAPTPSAEAVAELETEASEGIVEDAAETAEETLPSEAEPACPACGAAVQADEAFCATCGASLAQPPIAPETVAETEPESPVVAAEAEKEPEPAPEVAPEAVPEAAPEEVPEAAPETAPEEPPEVSAKAVPEEEPVSVPADEQPEPLPAAPAEEAACPACGVEIEPGDKFCSNCGAVLVPIPAPPIAVEAPPPASSAPAGPRLEVVTSGAEIPLAAGPELLIGREDPVSGIFPDVDLTPHGGEEGGVSRRHARIIVEGGSYFVEDLDSTNYTFVNKQKLAPGSRQPLNDGDELRCGRVALILRSG